MPKPTKKKASKAKKTSKTASKDKSVTKRKKAAASKKASPRARKKTVAPRLVGRRKEPKKISSRSAEPKKVSDIPNTTIALLAVLTLIFMIWSAAVFFANVNYTSGRAPTLEHADNLAPGAQLSLRIMEEPKSTATVGLTIVDESPYDAFTIENNT